MFICCVDCDLYRISVFGDYNSILLKLFHTSIEPNSASIMTIYDVASLGTSNGDHTTEDLWNLQICATGDLET